MSANFKILREEEIITKEVTEVEVSLLGYIGNQVTEARKRADINIAQLSRRLANSGFSISSTTLGRIEKGIASLKVEDLFILANYFGMGLAEFFPTEVLHPMEKTSNEEVGRE